MLFKKIFLMLTIRENWRSLETIKDIIKSFFKIQNPHFQFCKMNNSATIRLLHLRSFAIESCCLKVLSFKIKSRCLNTQCFVYNLTTQQMWQQKGFKYRMIVLKVPWLVKSHGQRTSVATTFYALFAHGSRIDTIKYLISDKPCPSSDHLQPGRWWR